MNVGLELKYMRKNCGLNSNEVSDYLNLDSDLLSKVEENNLNIDFNIIKSLIDLYILGSESLNLSILLIPYIISYLYDDSLITEDEANILWNILIEKNKYIPEKTFLKFNETSKKEGIFLNILNKFISDSMLSENLNFSEHVLFGIDIKNLLSNVLDVENIIVYGDINNYFLTYFKEKYPEGKIYSEDFYNELLVQILKNGVYFELVSVGFIEDEPFQEILNRVNIFSLLNNEELGITLKEYAFLTENTDGEFSFFGAKLYFNDSYLQIDYGYNILLSVKFNEFTISGNLLNKIKQYADDCIYFKTK